MLSQDVISKSFLRAVGDQRGVLCCGWEVLPKDHCSPPGALLNA